MNDFFLRNWSMVVVVAVLLIAVGMADWMAKVDLPGRGLVIRVADVVPLKSMEDASGPQIGLQVDGRSVEQGYLSFIIIKNNGNIPINNSDFEEAIKLQPTNEAKVIQVRYQFSPDDIDTTVRVDGADVVMTPTLLNPGDYVLIQAFTSGERPAWDADARVEGVSSSFTENLFREDAWGEISWMHFLVFALSLFNLLLMAVALKTEQGARYVVIPKKSAIVSFAVLALVALFLYFSLLVDHALTFFASKLLLLAFTLLTLLAAWQILRLGNRE